MSRTRNSREAVITTGSATLTGLLALAAVALVVGGADKAPGPLGDHGIRAAVLAALVVLVLAAALPGAAVAERWSRPGHGFPHPIAAAALLGAALVLAVLVPWPEAFRDGEVLIEALLGVALAVTIGQLVIRRDRREPASGPDRLAGAAAGLSLLGGIALGATIGLGAVVLMFGGATAGNALGLAAVLLLAGLVVAAAAFAAAQRSRLSTGDATAPHVIGPCRAGLLIGWVAGSVAPADPTALPAAAISGLLILAVAGLLVPRLVDPIARIGADRW